MRSSKQPQFIPLLMVMVVHGKCKQLIRSMMNKSLSRSLLLEYGVNNQNQISNQDQFIINKRIKQFTITELTTIMGYVRNSPNKQRSNPLLLHTLRSKMYYQGLLTTLERHKVWLQLTSYHENTKLYSPLNQLQLPTQITSAIQKDIKRTYLPGQDKQNTRQIKLQTLRSQCTQTLEKFAIYNPYISYCQGMNSIVRFLNYQGFNSEQSFYILCYVTEQLLPCDYYSSMNSTLTYLRILFQMLQFTHPKIYTKLTQIIQQVGCGFLSVMSYVFQWFVCLFTNNSFNHDITAIIWDYFLMQGITILFKSALVLFDYLEQYIILVHNFESYIKTIQQHINTFSDKNSIIQKFKNFYINNYILNLLKETLQPDKLNKTSKIKIYKQCNIKWNMCIQQIQQNITIGYKYQFFIMKCKQPINIIHTYFQKLNRSYFVHLNQNNSHICDNLKIGRIQHICTRITQSYTESSEKGSNEAEEKIQQYNKFLLSSRTLSIAMTPLSYQPYSQYTSTTKEEFRQQLLAKIEQGEVQKQLIHSQSMLFMKGMIQNESFSNLLELVEEQERQRICNYQQIQCQQVEQFNIKSHSNHQYSQNFKKK